MIIVRCVNVTRIPNDRQKWWQTTETTHTYKKANEERNTSRDHSFSNNNNNKIVCFIIVSILLYRIKPDWCVYNAFAWIEILCCCPIVIVHIDIVHSKVTIYRIQLNSTEWCIAISPGELNKRSTISFIINWLHSSAWFTLKNGDKCFNKVKYLFTYFNVHVLR